MLLLPSATHHRRRSLPAQSKEPDELEEYLVTLWSNADTEESGMLSVSTLRDLLRSADFGLTRLQIHVRPPTATHGTLGGRHRPSARGSPPLRRTLAAPLPKTLPCCAVPE